MLLFPLSAHAAPEMIPLEVFEAAKDPVVTAFSLPLRGGGVFTLDEHRGRPIVLSFWASWCSPCRKELPALSALAKERTDLEFIAVNVDRSAALAETFLAKIRVDLPVAFDPDAKALGGYGVTSMPTLFLIDRAGALAWRHTGYSEAKGFTELLAAVEGLR